MLAFSFVRLHARHWNALLLRSVTKTPGSCYIYHPLFQRNGISTTRTSPGQRSKDEKEDSEPNKRALPKVRSCSLFIGSGTNHVCFVNFNSAILKLCINDEIRSHLANPKF